MGIAIRSPKEIDELRKANKIVAQVLDTLKQHISPGITTLELDAIAADTVARLGALASFKGLYGFPASVCTSVNHVIIHGIPTAEPLKEGDIIGLDFGVKLNGWFGDAAITAGVGTISAQDQALIDCAHETLLEGIAIIEEGMRFKELSAYLEKSILKRGFVPLRSYCGHGIGRKPHEEPSIPNYLEGKESQGPKIKNGMVFCIEPMICHKEGEAVVLDDKWSVVSKDGLRGSHYEHTVAIVDGKAEILTLV